MDAEPKHAIAECRDCPTVILGEEGEVEDLMRAHIRASQSVGRSHDLWWLPSGTTAMWTASVGRDLDAWGDGDGG